MHPDHVAEASRLSVLLACSRIWYLTSLLILHSLRVLERIPCWFAVHSSYLPTYFTRVADVSSRQRRRSVSTNCLAVYRTAAVLQSANSSSVSSVNLWNKLSSPLYRNCRSLDSISMFPVSSLTYRNVSDTLLMCSYKQCLFLATLNPVMMMMMMMTTLIKVYWSSRQACLK